MRKLILWLCRVFKVQTVATKTKYVVTWLPKPDERELMALLMGLPFKAFMEHCQKKASIMIAMQSTPEKRNEFALLLEGVHSVEKWANEYIDSNSKKEEKVSPMDNPMSLDPEILVQEYDRMTEGENVGG